MIRAVGIGASAGGLQALATFFGEVPADTGLAYIVVQHLDPTHKAMLAELLQRSTSLTVAEAQDAQVIQANRVYVIPPNRELTLSLGRLRLNRPPEIRGRRLPIDALFCSLAREQGDLATGVLLSGMGSDGVLGLHAIRGQGGLTLAQTPASAQFDSMPSNAIASGCVDIIGLPDELARRVAQIRAASAEDRTEPTASEGALLHIESDETRLSALKRILELLRTHCKRDLSLYKTSTLLRRIERRVAIHRLPGFLAYVAFLEANPRELELMFAEMLIGVTSFFRDPQAWQELQDKFLPALLRQEDGQSRRRAWVVGCSTGEEAYSLAMACCEAQESESSTQPRPQIFATDLSAEAIAFARRGRYPAHIASEVSAGRLARFFTAHEGSYQVCKEIRDMVLFAQHDVIMDPPFTRLDFLSCRNLLIYFNGMLQRRLMPIFHYSLCPNAVLMLGSAETVGATSDLFVPLNLKARIYRRSAQPMRSGLLDFPVNPLAASPRAQELSVSATVPPPGNLQALADQILLQSFAPAAVLVNPEGDIVYISGRTGRYLEPAAGKANWNIHVMARPGLRTQLASALRDAISAPAAIELPGLRSDDAPDHIVNITVQALREPKAMDGMVLIVFRDAPQPRKRKPRRSGQTPQVTPEQEEIRRLVEEIRAQRQETQASKEELQATNEELQSINEELQSANEELTTSKEEAQSMNEELQTLNSELQSKLDDLALAQSDMQNLLNSTDIATLFLDKDLNVRRFTPQATKIIHLRDADIGRPLSDLTTTLNYPELNEDARETLRTLVFSEKQVSTTDQLWFSVRIMPYRTLANVIQGAVITFFDISAAKKLEASLRKE